MLVAVGASVVAGASVGTPKVGAEVEPGGAVVAGAAVVGGDVVVGAAVVVLVVVDVVEVVLGSVAAAAGAADIESTPAKAATAATIRRACRVAEAGLRVVAGELLATSDVEEDGTMGGLRVGVEVQATAGAVTVTMATLPWMSPERIALDSERCLVLVSTSFPDAAEACSYAERRVRKSAQALGLELDVLSTEAFPPIIDLRDSAIETNSEVDS